MFVRMLTSLAGVSFAYHAGEVAELDEKTALRLIESEQAETIEGSTDEPRRRGRPPKKDQDHA